MADDKSPVCSCCGGLVEDRDSIFYGDPLTYYDKKPLCGSCYFGSKPAATIYYDKDETPHIISLCRNETGGDFGVDWKPVDARRGYYTVRSEAYSQVLSDSILSCHESEQMLKDLDDRLTGLYSENGIDFARAFTKTSNVFSTGFEFWVKNAKNHLLQILKAHSLLERVKQEVNYYDPVYSTGIVIPRPSLKQLQKIFSDKYSLRNDHDLVNLMEERGDEIVREVSNAIIKGSGIRDKKP